MTTRPIERVTACADGIARGFAETPERFASGGCIAVGFTKRYLPDDLRLGRGLEGDTGLAGIDPAHGADAGAWLDVERRLDLVSQQPDLHAGGIIAGKKPAIRDQPPPKPVPRVTPRRFPIPPRAAGALQQAIDEREETIHRLAYANRSPSLFMKTGMPKRSRASARARHPPERGQIRQVQNDAVLVIRGTGECELMAAAGPGSLSRTNSKPSTIWPRQRPRSLSLRNNGNRIEEKRPIPDGGEFQIRAARIQRHHYPRIVHKAAVNRAGSAPGEDASLIIPGASQPFAIERRLTAPCNTLPKRLPTGGTCYPP